METHNTFSDQTGFALLLCGLRYLIYLHCISAFSICEILKAQSLNSSESLWGLSSITHFAWTCSEGRFLCTDTGSSCYSSSGQRCSEPCSALESLRGPGHSFNIGMSSSLVIWLAPSWKRKKNLYGFCFSHGLGVWTWSPYWLTSSQGELFWQLMWNKFWSDVFRASSHRPVFIFIEKEQSRETWPLGLYLRSTQ